MGECMKDWKQSQVISWIGTIDNSLLSETVKNKIIDGIKKYQNENDMEYSGKFLSMAEKDDLVHDLNIGGSIANTLIEIIETKLDSEFEDNNTNNNNNNNNDNDDTPFKLNFVGSQAKPIVLNNIRKTMTISWIKSLYLEEYGDETNAHKYAQAKWDKKEPITFKYLSQPMSDNNKKLTDYGCNDGLLPIIVVFKVKGGAEEAKYENELKYAKDDKDRFRKRKLRYRKYKEIILSKKPDCIMGYTDADGIKRAEMPCGCAIAADTMKRYMTSTFEKNLKAVKMYCPVSKDICNGTDQQRHWPWPLVFIVADLSQNEINRYSKAINNRQSGTKNCPHCKCVTERPDDLRMWRVNCTQCKKADWCWQCQKPWKGSGWGSICGNDNCLGHKLNVVLSNSDFIDPEAIKDEDKTRYVGWCKKQEEIPDMRACPKCLTLIEFTFACKHMVCLSCPHEFCFKCLKKWHTCGDGCVKAGIQQFK